MADATVLQFPASQLPEELQYEDRLDVVIERLLPSMRARPDLDMGFRTDLSDREIGVLWIALNLATSRHARAVAEAERARWVAVSEATAGALFEPSAEEG